MIDYLTRLVYNIGMTMQQLMSYEPIATDGKVLIDKKVFDQMKLLCTQAHIMNSIQKAESNYAMSGKRYDGNKVLTELREKYVKKI